MPPNFTMDSSSSFFAVAAAMWTDNDEPDVIHIDTVVCAAHLIGIAGNSTIPYNLHYSDSLTAFKTFYVNKYIDYQAYEIAF